MDYSNYNLIEYHTLEKVLKTKTFLTKDDREFMLHIARQEYQADNKTIKKRMQGTQDKNEIDENTIYIQFFEFADRFDYAKL